MEGWLMQQGKNNGGMYVLLLLVLGSSGLNLNTSSDINHKVGAISEWKAVAEYRITELEKQRGN